jgi:hypothetical protein
MFAQAVSLLAASGILVAYAGNQMGRMSQRGLAYLLLNLVGGAILTVTAIAARQAGLILMEGAWVVISAVGLARRFSRRS